MSEEGRKVRIRAIVGKMTGEPKIFIDLNPSQPGGDSTQKMSPPAALMLAEKLIAAAATVTRSGEWLYDEEVETS